MSVRMFGPVGARIVQVLRDYLPAELDLIDAEEGQAATKDVPDGNYWEYLRPVVPDFPAVRLDPKGMQVVMLQPVPFGGELDAWYRYEIWVDVQVESAEESAETLQDLVATYTKGIFRVLCLKKVELQTALDPTGWASHVAPDGEMRINAMTEQEGVMVRSGVVPVKVRRIEQL